MAGVEIGAGGSSKRDLAPELSMVPMIDLLLCCIMFLLVTAVWTQLGNLAVEQPRTVGSGVDEAPAPPAVLLVLQVRSDGYVLGDTTGARQDIPLREGRHDLATLGARLRERRSLEPNRRELVVAADDGVRYQQVVSALDASAGAGYSSLTVSPDRTW